MTRSRSRSRSTSGSRLPARAVAGAVLASALVVGGEVLAAAGPAPSVRVLTSREEVAVPAADAQLACPGPPAAAPTSSQLEGDSGAVPPATAVRALTMLPSETAPALGLAPPTAPTAAPSPSEAGATGPPLEITVPSTDASTDATVDPSTDPAGGAAGGAAPPSPTVGSRLSGAGGSLVAADGGAPLSVTASPVDGVEPLLAGASSALATTGDLRGLATPPCTSPTDESWLVGGATPVGDSTRLVVVNPTDTPATVRTDALVDTGAAVGGATLVPLPQMSLAPGQQRSVLLEGVVPGATSLAVRVRSDGADVSSWMVTTSLDGLVPRGTDVVTAGDGPSRSPVVPGVVVAVGEATPVLRLATAATQPVVARWQVSGPDGPLSAPGLRLAATVPPSGSVDVALDGLPAGTWTVTLAADAPVVAAVRRTTAADPAVASDLSWTGSARPLSGQVMLAVAPQPSAGEQDPPSMSSRLVLHAGSGDGGQGGTASVVAVDASGRLGAATTVTLPAQSTRTLDVAGLPRAGDGADGPVALLVAVGGGAPVVAAMDSSVPRDGEGARGGVLVSAHAAAPAPVSSAAVRVELRGSP